MSANLVKGGNVATIDCCISSLSPHVFEVHRSRCGGRLWILGRGSHVGGLAMLNGLRSPCNDSERRQASACQQPPHWVGEVLYAWNKWPDFERKTARGDGRLMPKHARKPGDEGESKPLPTLSWEIKLARFLRSDRLSPKHTAHQRMHNLLQRGQAT
jgi:hypothetical protein